MTTLQTHLYQHLQNNDHFDKIRSQLGKKLIIISCEVALVKSTVCTFSPACYKYLYPTQSEAEAETVAENIYCDEQEISWAAMVGIHGRDHIFNFPTML